MLIVPLQPLPNQSLSSNLGGQSVSLNVRQRRTGLFVDVLVAGQLVVGGVLAENFNRIVRSLYFGFIGDFLFLDTQGSTDPVWTGLGSRYLLIYLESSDLSLGVG